MGISAYPIIVEASLNVMLKFNVICLNNDGLPEKNNEILQKM